MIELLKCLSRYFPEVLILLQLLLGLLIRWMAYSKSFRQDPIRRWIHDQSKDTSILLGLTVAMYIATCL